MVLSFIKVCERSFYVFLNSPPEKEKKSLTPAVPVAAKPDKPSGKSGMDSALDDLIDTLGGPEETNEENTTYTGPVVSDPMSSTYIEELGKREVTIPPKYRELLAKKEGTTGPPPDSSKSMGPDDAIDALSSDFTCSSPTTGGKKSEKEKSSEVLKAESARVIRSTAPPQEKKRKVEEDAMSDQALEALSASLGTRKSDPEIDLSSIKEADEPKAKEENLEKCGEDEETIPSEYRLKPVTDKDGKPLFPEPEEKSKPLSESELIDELSKDFNQSECKEKHSKPTEKTEKSKATVPAPVAEVVSQTSMCSIQSAPPKPTSLKGKMPDDAVEALAGSLGKREADPEDGKPAVDKVKEKSKEEDREKLGEKEETIPPDYRLEGAKVNRLFSCFQNDKELDDALDKLSDSLGQRQPDPEDDKPMEDKVKEKAKAEHRNKLGERDDTIPPEYRHLLDNDGQDKPVKPPPKKSKELKTPDDDQDPIDALSGDLDNCPSTPKASQNTEKDNSKTASSSKAPKNEDKAKDPTKVTMRQ
uniref:Calpastatin n=1 Tax=Castor canadensis TaxID=51338 RepID=A0A8C0XT74_CASCN